MNDNPVRIPVWASTIIGALIGVAIALLVAVDVATAWRPAVAQALLTIAPIFGAVEYARARVTPVDRARRAVADARVEERADVVAELEAFTAACPPEPAAKKAPPRKKATPAKRR